MTPGAPRVLIVGVGSPHGDDQAGWWVLPWLARALPSEAAVLRQVRHPIDLIDWLPAGAVIVCDACRGGGPPGKIHRWQWPDHRDLLTSTQWSGTHDWPLPATLELADRLALLPSSVTIWAMEIRATGAGSESGAVQEAARCVAAMIARDVRQLLRDAPLERP